MAYKASDPISIPNDHRIIDASPSFRCSAALHTDSEKWYVTWKEGHEAEKTEQFTDEAEARSRYAQLRTAG